MTYDQYSEYEQLQQSSKSSQSNVQNINKKMAKGWEYTILKESALLESQHFDLSILPESFQDYAYDISYRMQAPLDFVAVGLIVSFSALAGRKFAIYPKQNDNWFIIPNLWGMIIGRPSVKKSPALAAATKNIDELESTAVKAYKKEMAEFNEKNILYQLKFKDANKRAAKKIQENKPSEAETIIENILKESPLKPNRKRYKVNDATVEKLGELMSKNPNGLLIQRDEVAGLLKHLEKNEYSADRKFYLEGWNGNNSFTYDRIGRGTIDIEAVNLSIIGSIQPSVLKYFIDKVVNDSPDNDGLIQRFQLMVYPEPDDNWEYVDKEPNSEAINKAHDVFQAIDQLESSKQIKVRFTSSAQELFINWYSKHETRFENSEMHTSIEAHLDKFSSLVPSLALLFHLADNPRKPNESIGKKDLEKSIKWAQYLESHAMKIYGMSLNNELKYALLISKRFKKLQNPFTLREVRQKNWSELKTNKIIQNALDILVDHKYLRVQNIKNSSGGRPSTKYYINPKVFESNTLNTATEYSEKFSL